jgi:predicted Rossmann fold nucleotide-binding protein DprA/Smf involved in DNA uptake
VGPIGVLGTGRDSVIIVEGKQYSGSLITSRLAMEFGREVSGEPGNVSQDVSFAPNLLIKQGGKLVTNAEDVIEELPNPCERLRCSWRPSSRSSGIC